MIRFGVAALVLVLILVAGAGAIQQSAWSQGYMMGLVAGGGEGDALSQYVLYNSGRGLGIGHVIGGFFKVGLIFIGLILLAKFVFGMGYIRRWHMAGGPGGEHHHGWHHHGPPWGRPQKDTESEDIDTAQPPAAQQAEESGAASTGTEAAEKPA
jgi:hypothetical protein